MVEVLDGTMVYVTVDEKKTVAQLKRLKEPAATYFLRRKKKLTHKKIAYHWLLNPVTIERLQISFK
jgi:hypothetical protein